MKKFMAILMMVVCIGTVGFFMTGCGPKSPDVPEAPIVYSLNNIEIYATTQENSQ